MLGMPARCGRCYNAGDRYEGALTMPSPFPGMDPYLEDPAGWRDVHHEFLSGIRKQLTPLLRPTYYARIEVREYVADPVEIDERLGVRYPDVGVFAEPGSEGSAIDHPGAVALAETRPVIVTTCLEEEIHESFLVVTDRATRQAVTVIEVLSPTNKLANSPGLESFAGKRSEIMRSPVHWVEIDLLRAGVSLPARGMIRKPHAYLVHVSPASMRPRGKLWPIRLDERLPVIPIPLKPEDADAPLDLQAVLEAAYDRAGYDYQIDYRAEPVPPLADDWAAWTDRLLRAKGLRPAS
jgi:hypothetical protein